MAFSHEQLNGQTESARQVRERLGSTTLLLMLICTWAVGVGVGVHWLWSYAQVPGSQGELSVWPTASQIEPTKNQPMLLMFAHPRCPCTRASIRELERLMAKFPGQAATYLVFTEPDGLADDWSWTQLEIGNLPGIRVLDDPGGREAKLFAAQTSGLTLLFSSQGELLFQGGITASRGHEGANDGIAALKRLINNQNSPVERTPVFGCPLQSPTFVALGNPIDVE